MKNGVRVAEKFRCQVYQPYSHIIYRKVSPRHNVSVKIDHKNVQQTIFFFFIERYIVISTIYSGDVNAQKTIY